MLFKGLLLKIETGQVLSEKQEKSLASKLMLIPSFGRTLVQLLLVLIIVIMAIVGILGGKEPLSEMVAFIISGVALVIFLYLLFFPKRRRITKYLVAVDRFYQTKFDGLDNFDLYYIGQHKNPHMKSLKAGKIYVLIDGYQFLFIDDYFKDTKYKMPSYLSNGRQDVYLRVIDAQKSDASRLIVTLDEIEYFYLPDKNIPHHKSVNNRKYETYFKNFFDQDIHMTDTCSVILRLTSGAVFRLSYDIYEGFQNAMPLKERQ